jgi:hypothetical protein
VTSNPYCRVRTYDLTKYLIENQVAQLSKVTRAGLAALEQPLGYQTQPGVAIPPTYEYPSGSLHSWQSSGESANPPPSVSLNAAILRQQQEELNQVHSKSRSRNSDIPTAPTSSQPPFQFGAASPYGDITYGGKPLVTRENLHIPVHKKKKHQTSISSSQGTHDPNAAPNPSVSMQFDPSISVGNFPQPSPTISPAITPRNLSRQTSPSAMTGPTSKKRKATRSGKVPAGLIMTKVDMAQPGPTTSTAPSPFASFPQPAE